MQFGDFIPSHDYIYLLEVLMDSAFKKLTSTFYNCLLQLVATNYSPLNFLTNLPTCIFCTKLLFIYLDSRQQYSPSCPRCDETSDTFSHLIWSCPAIQDYWAKVARFLHDQMGSPLTLCSKQHILGLLSNSDNDKHLHIFLLETLFLAKLFIARV